MIKITDLGCEQIKCAVNWCNRNEVRFGVREEEVIATLYEHWLITGYVGWGGIGILLTNLGR